MSDYLGFSPPPSPNFGPAPSSKTTMPPMSVTDSTSVSSTAAAIRAHGNQRIAEKRSSSSTEKIANPSLNGSSAPATMADVTPVVRSQLENILQKFNQNANGGHSATGSGLNPTAASLQESALAMEQKRHETTKRQFERAQIQVNELVDKLEDRENDLEGFRVDTYHLKRRVDESARTINSLRDKLADQATTEQELSLQIQTTRSLESRLKTEMEGRHTVEVDLASIRKEHREAREQIERERKEHAEAIEAERRKYMEAAEKQERRHRQELSVAQAVANEKELALSYDRDEQVSLLREQLEAANMRLAERDQLLAEATADKRELQAGLFDARLNIEETAAVFGEASMAFSSEVDRLMGALLTMKTSVGRVAGSSVAKTAAPAQSAQPVPTRPTLPPTPVSTPKPRRQ